MQGNCPDRSYGARKCVPPQSEETNLKTSFAHLEQKKKADEDDYMVPIYVHSRRGDSNDKTHKNFSGNKVPPKGSRHFACTTDVQNNSERSPKQTGLPNVTIRRDLSSSGQEVLLKVSPHRDRNVSKGKNIDCLVRQAKANSNQDFPMAILSRSHEEDACIQPECGAESQSSDTGHGEGLVESTRDTETASVPSPRSCFHSTADKNGPVEVVDKIEYHDTRTSGPVQNGHIERSVNFSKASMVDNLSNSKISPDDVVEVIGQKRFWKARRAIAK